MELIDWSTDKYISYRLEGLDCDAAFAFTKLAAHRYFADFLYHSGEPCSDLIYSQLLYILEDIRFTQNSEVKFQLIANPLKIKRTQPALDPVAIF